MFKDLTVHLVGGLSSWYDNQSFFCSSYVTHIILYRARSERSRACMEQISTTRHCSDNSCAAGVSRPIRYTLEPNGIPHTIEVVVDPPSQSPHERSSKFCCQRILVGESFSRLLLLLLGLHDCYLDYCCLSFLLLLIFKLWEQMKSKVKVVLDPLTRRFHRYHPSIIILMQISLEHFWNPHSSNEKMLSWLITSRE